jgi:magnesium-transporting ATPase (P-type)
MPSQPNNGGLRGLTREQAAARFEADGPNELPSAKPRSFLAIAWEVLREPMILLLVAAGVIYLVLGEPRDSLVLLISIFAILGIDLISKTKRNARGRHCDIFPAPVRCWLEVVSKRESQVGR